MIYDCFNNPLAQRKIKLFLYLLTMFNKLVKRTLIRTPLYSISNIQISPIKRHCTQKNEYVDYNESPLNPSTAAENQQRLRDHRHQILNNEFPDDPTHPNISNTEGAKHVLRTVRSHIIPETDNDNQYEEYTMVHSIWNVKQIKHVEPTHKKPTRAADYFAYGSVLFLRSVWDLSTGYLFGRQMGLFKFSHRMWLLRIVYLETAAAVPGMMFGMCRHLQSLRRLERDRGWIRCLLAEAENERIHLLTAMHLYKPGKPLRYAILLTQGIMCNYLFLAYLISPRYGHSFVGYVEEQAVKTYTNLLKDIDEGKYPQFELPASNLSISYWKLLPNATWRDVFANMRADEVNHRDVNHGLADLVYDRKAFNPWRKKDHV
eukprot:749163_1